MSIQSNQLDILQQLSIVGLIGLCVGYIIMDTAWWGNYLHIAHRILPQMAAPPAFAHIHTFVLKQFLKTNHFVRLVTLPDIRYFINNFALLTLTLTTFRSFVSVCFSSLL